MELYFNGRGFGSVPHHILLRRFHLGRTLSADAAPEDSHQNTFRYVTLIHKSTPNRANPIQGCFWFCADPKRDLAGRGKRWCRYDGKGHALDFALLIYSHRPGRRNLCIRPLSISRSVDLGRQGAASARSNVLRMLNRLCSVRTTHGV